MLTSWGVHWNLTETLALTRRAKPATLSQRPSLMASTHFNDFWTFSFGHQHKALEQSVFYLLKVLESEGWSMACLRRWKRRAQQNCTMERARERETGQGGKGAILHWRMKPCLFNRRRDEETKRMSDRGLLSNDVVLDTGFGLEITNQWSRFCRKLGWNFTQAFSHGLA